jgi:phosphatidylglycerol lysyltransferase
MEKVIAASATDALTTARARQLVMVHGRNATAYQILNPGINHWFASEERAVVGFVRRGSWLLVAGEPICASDHLAAITHEFEEFARKRRRKVCYVLAGEAMRNIANASGEHSAVGVGAQPIWNPEEWQGHVRTRRSFRAQLHRSVNKGVAVEQMSPNGARLETGIHRTLKEWLASRKLPPMHFLVEPNLLDGVVDDRLLFAARHKGRIVAFLVASPVAACNGYLIEELARSPVAPNGTSELLIDTAMRRFVELGCGYATMGLVALATGTTSENPLWLRSLMYVARAHANRFYNFRGLERFRAKMNPREWEKLYAISNERHFSPQALYAMGGAFSGISPVRAILIAILKGAWEEMRTLRRKLSR